MEAKEIGNVVVLDIRKATEKSIAGIKSVGNVVTLVYSPETAHLVSQLNIGNVVNLLEAPVDAKILNYPVEFTHDYFEGKTEPVDAIIIGKLTVHPDVSVEQIQQGISDLKVVGKITCPKSLLGALEAKLSDFTGKIKAYMQCDRLFTQQVVWDENALSTIEDDSVIAILSDLKIPKLLPIELLERKIQKLQVLGQIVCHEENAAVLLSRLENPDTAVKIIPAGFEYVEKPLTLDKLFLDTLNAKKIYCTERILIEQEVEVDDLDAKQEKLITEEMVICPVGLADLLAKKCNLLETQAVFYEGKLWIVEDVGTISPEHLSYLEDNLTLLVTGLLIIKPEVSPEALLQKFAKVHNLGRIKCTPEQMGAIQSRLGLQVGGMIDSTKKEDYKQEGIGNIVHLAL